MASSNLGHHRPERRVLLQEGEGQPVIGVITDGEFDTERQERAYCLMPSTLTTRLTSSPSMSGMKVMP